MCNIDITKSKQTQTTNNINITKNTRKKNATKLFF